LDKVSVSSVNSVFYSNKHAQYFFATESFNPLKPKPFHLYAAILLLFTLVSILIKESPRCKAHKIFSSSGEIRASSNGQARAETLG
jgi:hypothetical protein